MKVTVKFSCGHTGEIEVFGKAEAREKAVYKAENYQVCPECRAKEREENIRRAAEENREAGMVPLAGSEKQIAWAETIRAKIIGEIEALPAEAGKPAELKGQILDFYKKETSAKAWIDMRDKTARGLVIAAAQAIKENKES